MSTSASSAGRVGSRSPTVTSSTSCWATARFRAASRRLSTEYSSQTITMIVRRRTARAACSRTAATALGAESRSVASTTAPRTRSRATSPHDAARRCWPALSPYAAATKSPCRTASQPKRPATKTARSRLGTRWSFTAAIERPVETTSSTVCLRVATNRLTRSCPLRADAFHSRSLTSSPRTYSRRSLSSIERPVYTDAYSPSSRPSTLRCAWISSRALIRGR